MIATPHMYNPFTLLEIQCRELFSTMDARHYSAPSEKNLSVFNFYDVLEFSMTLE